VTTDTIEITPEGVIQNNELLPNLNNYIISYTQYPCDLSSENFPESVLINNVPESEWVYLPNYNFSVFSGWNARSILSISCSKDVEQILLYNQKITITDNENN
jgi:hypothetical protein